MGGTKELLQMLGSLGSETSGVGRFVGKLKANSEEKRMSELARKFMAMGDYSPRGLQKFAQENGLSIDDMKELATIGKAFGMYARNAQPGESMEVLKEGNEWGLPANTIVKHDSQGGFSIVSNPNNKGLEKTTNLYSVSTGNTDDYDKDTAEKLRMDYQGMYKTYEERTAQPKPGFEPMQTAGGGGPLTEGTVSQRGPTGKVNIIQSPKAPVEMQSFFDTKINKPVKMSQAQANLARVGTPKRYQNEQERIAGAAGPGLAEKKFDAQITSRVIANLFKLHGFSEFKALNTDDSEMIANELVVAQQALRSGATETEAVQQAYASFKKAGTVNTKTEEVPRRGMMQKVPFIGDGGSLEEPVAWAKQMLELGQPENEIRDALIEVGGWEKEADAILKEARGGDLGGGKSFTFDPESGRLIPK
ncbi:hypothetical protein LCGC14_1507650 [marine sediment metagenome]|uniref:Uncharacterized protein n=1 Tax=marine sediment metagenome TaxID=412755 RepID=A0A0F9J2P7_9ZZZZ